METIEKLNLFLVHCGYHDPGQAADGMHNLFQNRHNFYAVARNPAEAKARVKEFPLFKARKMHVDGMDQIEVVDGFRVKLEPAGPVETEIRHVTCTEERTP